MSLVARSVLELHLVRKGRHKCLHLCGEVSRSLRLHPCLHSERDAAKEPQHHQVEQVHLVHLELAQVEQCELSEVIHHDSQHSSSQMV